MLTPLKCNPDVPDVYVVTEKGKAYIDALKNVKEPIQKIIWEQP
jgi:hypothetical protein